MKRSARTLVLFTGLVVCGSVPAAAFEIASQSHHLDRFRLEPAEPLVIRFDRSLARASVASDSIRILCTDRSGVVRVAGTTTLDSTTAVDDTLRFAPSGGGFAFGRPHRIVLAPELRGADGSVLTGALPRGDVFVPNKPSNLSEELLEVSSALIGYDVKSPEKTDPNDPLQIPGISTTEAWKRSIGRPDVLIAVLDDGLESYGSRSLRESLFLNRGELPLPANASDYDANHDGRFNADDYAGDPRVGDHDHDGRPDAEDLMTAFSDGVDDDGNGLVDDVSGWDFFRNRPRALGVREFPEGTHGQGRAEEAVGAPGDTGAVPGGCPDCSLLMVRVSDTILVEGNLFAAGLRYATAMGARVVLAAVGGVDNPRALAEAVQAANDAGMLLVVASGDELSFHHNYPAALPGTYQVKSIFPLPFGAPHYVETYCTNWGAHMDAAVSSSNCSSEATGNTVGLFGALLSRARDLGIELSGGELRQILNGTADDIASSCVSLTGSSCQPGFDAHFGYGRPNGRRAMDVLGDPTRAEPARIPPAVEIQAPGWFDIVDPRARPSLDVSGTIAARGRPFDYALEAATGVEPRDEQFRVFASGSGRDAFDGTFGSIDLAALFGGAPPTGAVAKPDDPTVTLRVRVTAGDGTRGEIRRAVGVHSDPDALPSFPKSLGSSGESSALLVDLGGGPPGQLDLVLATSDGLVHAFRRDSSGAGWNEATGFPVSLPAAIEGGITDGAIASAAYGDLYGDGTGYAIVVATVSGRIYAIHPRGAAHLDAAGKPSPFLPGFPVEALAGDRSSSRAYAHGTAFIATPTLADLDGDGSLEIIAASFDQRLYAFHPRDGDGDGRADPATGFPVLLRSDAGRVPAKLVCLDRGQPAIEASILTSPVAVTLEPGSADPDLSRHPAIVAATTELCDDDGDGEPDTGRYYAVWHDGQAHAGGPFVSGWPVATPTTTIGATIPLPPLTTGGDFGPAAGVVGGETLVYGGNFLGFPFVVRTRSGTTSIELLLSGDGDLAAGGGATIARFDPSSEVPTLLVPTATILDQGPGIQALDHNIVGWRAEPPYERVIRAPMDDIQFLSNPAVADVSGDGRPEVIGGSGGYLLRAYDASLAIAPGWPRYTQGWIVASPSLGDVDGDGRLEVVIPTREGNLFAWRTAGATCRADGAWQPEWWTYHRDEHRSGVYGHDSLAPARLRELTRSSDVDGSIELGWIAPGGDGPCGRAARYDVRYATDPSADLSDPVTFAAAPSVSNPPSPAVAGSRERFHFVPPPDAVSYAIRAIDEHGLIGLPAVASSAAQPGRARHSGGCTVADGAASDGSGDALAVLALIAPWRRRRRAR
ncbi:MAG: S8 family serine peptidase, partial [bacterium]